MPFEAMAIAGKTLRCSARCGADDAHLLSAFSQRLGVVLGQVAVPDKSNEITAIDDLLTRLVLTGWVVTTDALFTQREIARTICDAGGDYLMAVKGNQPTLHVDLTLLFADADAACQCAEKATGETHSEVAYAITFLAPTAATPAQLLVLWREHWHIENNLHRIRDVTFDEDRSTVRAGSIPQAMVTLRSTAMMVARVHGATIIAPARRRYAAQPALALAAIGLTPRL